MLSQQLARTDGVCQSLNRISLRLWNDVRVQSERDSWVTVSELSANSCDARTTVNQRSGDTVSERVKAR